MITVLGNYGCGKCKIIKQELDKKDIEYRYVNLSDLDIEEKQKFVSKAKEEGRRKLPIIFKNDEIINDEELI